MWRESWRDFTKAKLQALIVSALRSWRPVPPSCLLSCATFLPTAIQPLNILGEVIEMVEDYRCLGVHTGSKLNWKTITKLCTRRGWAASIFWGNWDFDACSRILDIFYQSVVASALFYAVVCWGGSIGGGNTNRINKRIRKVDAEQTAVFSG